MSLSGQQRYFTIDISKLILEADRLQIGLTFGEAYRTRYQQDKYVKDGKSKTMKSNHLKRLAVDFNFFIDGNLTYKKEDIQELGDFWESLNPQNKWGGNYTSFIDTPHFERMQK